MTPIIGVNATVSGGTVGQPEDALGLRLCGDGGLSSGGGARAPGARGAMVHHMMSTAPVFQPFAIASATRFTLS